VSLRRHTEGEVADHALVLLGRLEQALMYGSASEYLGAARTLRAWLGEHADMSDPEALAAMAAVDRFVEDGTP
jgi:hypothetical protein